jgi:diguanylate cyclase (GGDEF)-like protein
LAEDVDARPLGQTMTAREPRVSELPTVGRRPADPAEVMSLFECVASASSVGLGFIDRNLRAMSITPVFASVNGGAVEDQVGRLLNEVVPGLWSQLEQLDQRAREHNEPVVATEIAGTLSGDPRTHHWWASFYPVTVLGEFIGIGLVVVDVTERKEVERELRDQSLHDALTGLANRALLLDRAKQLMEVARHDQRPVSVLFMDLDNFKTINDGLGHQAGDELLVAVARRLAGALRSEETVCRFGDDEFVILASSGSVHAPPELMAARVMDVLRSPFEVAGHVISVTTSIGIASGFDLSAEDLIRNAHIAMYKAKMGGKNATVSFIPSMQEVIADRLQLEIDMRAAVELGQFAVLYQPIIDLSLDSLTGVEALVRWDHPVRGRLGPAEFLGLAEDTGMIRAIGRLVLREACASMALWRNQGMPLSLAVNISPCQLESPHLVEEVRHILEETGLDPAALVLEITESLVMREMTVVIERLKALKEIGVRLAVDDFGTGYSSLSYLQQFPIDILKIDQSFVLGIRDSPEQRAIVHALIELGRALELEIIAEGVETDAQLRLLRQEGCDSAQGYLFAPPLARGHLELFAREWRLRHPK